MKKNIINIIFYLLVTILIYMCIRMNNDFKVLVNKNIINNYKDYIKYKDYNYVTINLSDGKETRFSIKDNNINKSDIYYVKFDDKTLLIELSSSSVLTSKVNLMKKNDNKLYKELKNDIITEVDDVSSFEEGYYSNVKLNDNMNVLRIKSYISISLLFICIIMLILNVLSLLIKVIFKNN